MVASIINAVVASQEARGEAEAPPEERNTLAKQVMQEIEKQRRGAGR